MKVCVLQPGYSTTSVDYKNYDPPRNLSALLPGDEVDHVFLNKLTTYNQLKQLSKKKYDVFVNLCEGYLEWEVPSIDVIYFLELLNLPFTGPSSVLYDPPKELMKYVAYTEGVSTPAYALIEELDDLAKACSHLHFPLFVKPAKAGDSLGIDEHSLVKNQDELYKKQKEEDGYDFILNIPFADKADMDMGQKGSELMIQIKNEKRCFTLPDILRNKTVQNARYEEGQLHIKFA